MVNTYDRILVTGGCGFIGSQVVRDLCNQGVQVFNIDLLTYASTKESTEECSSNKNYQFSQLNIADSHGVNEVLKGFQPQAIINLAAETHVDRSIDGPAAFIETNILGTFRLLECSLKYWKSISASAIRDNFRFLHISTDEVYGSLGADGLFSESSQYQPNSPYSASKASADHLVRAWHHTYGLPTLTTNCSNNYGPWQFPEKLIPLTIIRALQEQSLPVYGKGENIRDWLHVADHSNALITVLNKGTIGEVYLVGGNAERKNLDVVHQICAILDKLRPRTKGSYRDLITFVEDRPGHDLRYAIDCNKLKTTLGWTQRFGFEEGLKDTVQWYLQNQNWWGPIIAKKYHAERLGLKK